MTHQCRECPMDDEEEQQQAEVPVVVEFVRLSMLLPSDVYDALSRMALDDDRMLYEQVIYLLRQSLMNRSYLRRVERKV